MSRRRGNFQNFLHLADIHDFSEIKDSPAFRQRPKNNEEYAFELHSRIFELRKQNFALKRRALQRGLILSENSQASSNGPDSNPPLSSSDAAEVPATQNPTKNISLKALGRLAGAASRMTPAPALLSTTASDPSIAAQKEDAISEPSLVAGDDSSVTDMPDDSSLASSLTTSGPLPQPHTGVAEELSDLTKHVDSLIEDAKKTISRNPQDALPPPSPEKGGPKDDPRGRRRDVRDKIDALLKAKFFGIVKTPLWRHKLAGNNNPEPETILKGADLFRAIGRLVLYIYAKPVVAIRNRKREDRDKEQKELARTIHLFISSCSTWMGKAVKLPVQSTHQDHTLNFHPENPHRVSATSQQRMMQMKVRMQSIVRGLVALEMPPPHITSFLCGLIADDNYFSPNFLYSFEHSQLDFNTLGGTRRVLHEVSAGSDVPEQHRYTHSNGKTYSIRRSLLIIKGFLLIKVLIYTMLLSPWSCGLCARPVKKKRLIIDNMRCLASCIYWMLRVSDPTIPAIPYVKKKGRMWMNRNTDPAASSKSWFQSIISTSDTTVAEPAKNEESDVSAQMLAMDRPLFVAIDELHHLLVPDEIFRNVSESASIWITELSDMLEEWMIRITKHVIDYRIELEAAHTTTVEKNVST